MRRLAQCTAFLTPAACLTAAAMSDDGTARVALITASLGMASFSLAGLYCNHADLSPKYAPLLLGCTNTAGAIPGIFGVALTGILLDRTDSWGVALFAPCVLLFVAGSFVFCTYGRYGNGVAGVEQTLHNWSTTHDNVQQHMTMFNNNALLPQHRAPRLE